jgi:hypothetical protein
MPLCCLHDAPKVSAQKNNVKINPMPTAAKEDFLGPMYRISLPVFGWQVLLLNLRDSVEG